jgi:hypothetical protein
VTQLWPNEDDAVFLYRRSVLSLIPALSGQVAATVLTFLFSLAGSIGVVDIEKQVREALGHGEQPDSDDDRDDASADAPIHPPSSDRTERDQEGCDDPEVLEGPHAVDDPETSDDLDDILVGNDAFDALQAVLNGPALQILPLGLCV